jgi:hypothetical protein
MNNSPSFFDFIIKQANSPQQEPTEEPSSRSCRCRDDDEDLLLLDASSCLHVGSIICEQQ